MDNAATGVSRAGEVGGERMRVVYFPNALGYGRIDAGESEK